MNIELFPVEKSCEQGCITCPLARKDSDIIDKKINDNVQETFTLLEHLLKEFQIPYNLHTTALENLFPTIAFPELIQMARFETSKNIYEPGVEQTFSAELRKLLKNRFINPPTLGISYVPKFPVLEDTDSAVLKRLLQEISSWYFREKNKTIEVTVRSNLIPIHLWRMIYQNLFQADKVCFGNVLKSCTSSFGYKRGFIISVDNGEMYYTLFEGTIDTNCISISNRVIGSPKGMNSTIENIDQALSLYPHNIGPLDIAIAPKGVMLMHTSLAINNPILWMSHAAFRYWLCKDSSNPRFSLLTFVQNIIRQNALIYELLHKHKSPNVRISQEEFMCEFERWRFRYFKKQTNEAFQI